MARTFTDPDDIILSANEPQAYATSGNSVQTDGTVGDIVFRTSGVERARIKADGTGTGWPNVLGGSLPSGTRAVFLGDSLMAGNGNEVQTNQSAWSITIPTYAAMASKGKLIRVRNAGVAGNTAAQMLARFDTDVSPYSPAVVVLMAGVNDANDAVATTLANYAASIQAIKAKCGALKATLVLCTIPPNIGSSTRRARVTLYNGWLRRYASQQGLPLWDAYKFFVDPATGDYLAAYAKEGTHPNNAGFAAAGSDLWTYLSTVGFLTPITSLLPQENADPNNLITNGLFLNTTGSGTTLKPTGWSISPSSHPTGVTASFDTSDTSIRGSWYKLVADGTATAQDLLFLSVAGIIPGHLYAFVGRSKATGMRAADSGAGSQWNIGAAFNGTLNDQLYDFRNPSSASYDLSEGAFYHEMTAPSDASTVQIRSILLNTTTGAGTLQIAQLGLYDLTALGLDGSI